MTVPVRARSGCATTTLAVSKARVRRGQSLLAIVADRDSDESRSTTSAPSMSGLALKNQATADPAVAPMITTW